MNSQIVLRCSFYENVLKVQNNLIVFQIIGIFQELHFRILINAYNNFFNRDKYNKRVSKYDFWLNPFQQAKNLSHMIA
jgi:hypothetical protein